MSQIKTVFWEIVRVEGEKVRVRFWRKETQSDSLTISIAASMDQGQLRKAIYEETGLRYFNLIYWERKK